MAKEVVWTKIILENNLCASCGSISSSVVSSTVSKTTAKVNE